ncbi:ABC transporter permease [Thermophilibacter immobilis]|jgi:simple sugar transport system permease protein|uniref:ABC transporter permease n=1 Tax=Thermophilibacter immobilis TaxID=2779519 RepID=A0A7S7M851_9ACTN|nr:ABC transporter permease [Thermophilibacter immobilis]QOY60531.1 ABC transporter permease [Thermophilibacter immobilis]
MSTFTKILKKPIVSAIVAILFGFGVAAIVLASAGYDPAGSFAALFNGALGRPKYIANVIIKATPLLLTGCGVAFAYKAGLFNIGGEGQYICGTVLAVVVGSQVNLPAPLQIPLVILAGTAGGALLGAFVGWLKGKFGIHEVITSIMLNWIMLYLCNFVVQTDTFHRANSTGAIPVNESSFTMILPNWKVSEAGQKALSGIPWLQEALVKTDANVGFAIALLAAIFIAWLLTKTKVGYEIRAVGLARDAAQFAGINVQKNIVLCMLISGGLCGLAGALTITGISPHSISTIAAFENYGFNGLSVAFIAGCSPLGCIPASLLFAGLIYGGQTVQQVMGAPSEIINIMIGTIVFFMALGGIVPKLAERIERRRALAAEGALVGASPTDASGGVIEMGAEKNETSAYPIEQEASPVEPGPVPADPDVGAPGGTDADANSKEAGDAE